jgi:hypothetical protein
MSRWIDERDASGSDVCSGQVLDCRRDGVQQLQCRLRVSHWLQRQQPRSLCMCSRSLLSLGRLCVQPVCRWLCVPVSRFEQPDGGAVHTRAVLRSRCRNVS